MLNLWLYFLRYFYVFLSLFHLSYYALGISLADVFLGRHRLKVYFRCF